MSATTTPRPARPAPGARTQGPTFGRVVASEWTRLTSLRSSWWTATVTVLVAGLITYASASASSVDPGFEPSRDLSSGLLLAQIGPLVLGVLAGAGEFRTGAFRTTFTLVPRRWPALAAQALVMAVLATGVGILTVVVSALALVPSATSRDLPLGLTSEGMPGVMGRMVLLVVGLALLGFALGALLRRTVPAMITALVLVIFLPFTLAMVADPGVDPTGQAVLDEITVPGAISTFMPGTAAQLMATPASNLGYPGMPDVGPVGSSLVLGAWVVLLLGLAAVRLHSRDVR